MKKRISPKIISLVFSILVICFAVGFYVFGWIEPGASPPAGNVDAPVNVGGDLQYKSGSLGVGGLSVDFDTYLAVDGGKVGIGTTSPGKKLDVEGYVKGRTGLCIGNDCRTSWPSGAGDFTCSSLDSCCSLNGKILKRIDGKWECGVDMNTDMQDLSINGHTISLTNGGSVTVPDNDTWIDTQTCPSGQYLTKIGKTSITCSTPSTGGANCQWYNLEEYDPLGGAGTKVYKRVRMDTAMTRGATGACYYKNVNDIMVFGYLNENKKSVSLCTSTDNCYLGCDTDTKTNTFAPGGTRQSRVGYVAKYYGCK